jgi:Methylase involved in ubiquinone/menaquinone biosynthesis
MSESVGFPVSLLSLLRCTGDGGELAPPDGYGPNGIIHDGVTRCLSCGATFPIVDGVLDLLADSAPEDELSDHERQLRDTTMPMERGVPGWKPDWRDTAEFHTTLARLGDISGKTLLELGCGPGLYTHQLAQKVSAMIALDFSWKALRRNKANLPSSIPPGRVGYVRADVSTIKLCPRAFDVALTTLYSNLPTKEIRLACNSAVHEGLKPGGLYLVSTHHQDMRKRLRKYPVSGRYTEGGIYYINFTRKTLAQELTAFSQVTFCPAVVELPLVLRMPSFKFKEFMARATVGLPGFNEYGTILLAQATKSRASDVATDTGRRSAAVGAATATAATALLPLLDTLPM